MATTTTYLSLRRPESADRVNVTTDISGNMTLIDAWFAPVVGSTQAIGDAAAAGSNSTVARSDHKHAMPAFGAIASIGTANDNGVAATIARSDHVHVIGTAAINAASMIAPGIITDAEINASAAIAVTKIVAGSASTVLTTNSGGTQAWGTVTSAMITDGTIVNADISASAAIDVTKIAAGTASTVLTTNSGGTQAWGTVTSAMITDGTIVNADINASAAIDVTKIAAGSASTVLTTNSGGTQAWGTVTSAMITDGAIVNADINASAAIAVTKIAAGSASTVLTTNSGGTQAWGTVTPAMSDLSVTRNNYVINPGFETWTEGTSWANGALTASTDISVANSWIANKGTGGTTLTIDREATTVKTNSLYSLKAVQASRSGSSQVYQNIADPTQLRGQLVTFAIDVYTTTASAVRISLYYNGTGAGHNFSSYHAGGGWERLSKTATVSVDATSVAADVWLDANCTAYLDNAMFTYGSYAPEYVPLSPGLESAKLMMQTPGQLLFPATQNASTNVNALDDYEEGTWTPVVAGATTAGTNTYSYQFGRYAKIGSMVQFDIFMGMATKDAAMAGSVYMSLPFTARNWGFANGNGGISVAAGANITLTASYTQVLALVLPNTTRVSLQQVANGSAASWLDTTNISGTFQLSLGGCYSASS
jgi:hypothetical protein